MAEGHNAVTFRLQHTPGQIEFDSHTVPYRGIVQQAVQNVYQTSRRSYFRFYQIAYPAKTWSLGVWTAGIWAIERYNCPTTINALIQSSTNTIESSWRIVQSYTLNLLLSKLPYQIKPKYPKRWLAKLLLVGSSWVVFSFTVRWWYRLLLSYEQFLYESPRQGYSWKTKIWFLLLKIFRGYPQLYACQRSLPALPLPTVRQTCQRWLDSVEPILDTEEFSRMKDHAVEFEKGIGFRLQFYLRMKWLFCDNYVTNWWEKYVYLRPRAPIMVKSNYYIIGQGNGVTTSVQSARAAVAVYGCMLFREEIDDETFFPQMASGVRPICMGQYEQLFNTTRIAKDKETDEIVHYETSLKKSNHIIVINRGRFFRIDCYPDKRLLSPAELQDQFEMILQDESKPQPGEDMFGALTAGSRDNWQKARNTHFKDSVNARALEWIETSAFVVCLDDESYDNTIDFENPDLNKMAKSLLHGKTTDRWFDKSFNIVAYKCGNIGVNGEHAFADAPVVALMIEKIFLSEFDLGYDSLGNARGERFKNREFNQPRRIRLQLTTSAIDDVKVSYNEAKILADDVDLCLFPFKKFDKVKITKKFKTSPDAFVQAALQLAHFYDKGRYVLTYESAMTRFYLKGRTETVRSCSDDLINFLNKLMSMNDQTDKTVDKTELKNLYFKHAENHVNLNKAAMTGQGCDRHLFALYVMAYGLGLKSQFLTEALGMKWGLSTSQTPAFQLDSAKKLFRSPGGGFGPVDDDGYGVSYIFMDKDLITFHVSSRHSSSETDSRRLVGNIGRAMDEIAAIFEC